MMGSTSQIRASSIPSNKKVEKLGFPFLLIFVYMIMEYGRPANPMHIPMLISAILFFKWLQLPKKHWNPQIICFFLLLGVIAVMGPFAVNNFTVLWDFLEMTVLLLCICVPTIHVVNSMNKLSVLINALIALFVYIVV